MFKAYCLAMTPRGPRVFPGEAFKDYERYRSTSWAVLIEHQDDEKILLDLKPHFAWLVKLADRRGFGAAQVQQSGSMYDLPY